jgi:hypothetical protein
MATFGTLTAAEKKKNILRVTRLEEVLNIFDGKKLSTHPIYARNQV